MACWFAGVGLAQATAASKVEPRMEVLANLAYAGTEHPRQTLDLYLPKERKDPARLPVVVHIHGGGWVRGDKSSGKAVLQSLVESGDYAGVSVGYRLAGEAQWPAQIHDCKAAIRWIRAYATQYGLDAERIGVTGGSAGGTLATLLGTSGGVRELEGEVGPHRGENSRVACVVNRFGRINFLAEPAAARSAPAQAEALAGRLKTLFGGSVEEKSDLARQASPLTYLTPDDPPVLTIHGTGDNTVPIAQAEELDAALKRAGLPHFFVRVVGAGHGFDSPEDRVRSRIFFDRYLRGIEAEISNEPIVRAAKKKKAQ